MPLIFSKIMAADPHAHSKEREADLGFPICWYHSELNHFRSSCYRSSALDFGTYCEAYIIVDAEIVLHLMIMKAGLTLLKASA